MSPTSTSTSTPDRGPLSRKATLFCPDCGHESPVDGDWRVREHAESIEYHCPSCDRRIAERDRDRRLLKA